MSASMWLGKRSWYQRAELRPWAICLAFLCLEVIGKRAVRWQWIRCVAWRMKMSVVLVGLVVGIWSRMPWAVGCALLIAVSQLSLRITA